MVTIMMRMRMMMRMMKRMMMMMGMRKRDCRWRGDCFGESFQLVSKALMFQKWHNFYDDDDFCHHPAGHDYFDDKNALLYGDNVWIMMTDWRSHDISIFQAHKGNVRKRARLQNAHFLLLGIFTFLPLSLPSTQRLGKYTKLKASANIRSVNEIFGFCCCKDL